MTACLSMRNAIRISVLAACSLNCAAQTIRLGTIAPAGTYWHQLLQETNQEWRRLSNGKVSLTIYPGGVQGDERDMLRKVRLNQLQAVGLSGVGLGAADPSVLGLLLPMLADSYPEYDYILAGVRPKLEEALNRAGFVVLQWSDAGWVHFFTKRPARTLAEVKRLKLFTNAGDPTTENLLKTFGFNPIPISANELLPQLQTGLIDAFDVPPLFALSNQSFALAKNMLDIKWSPLPAATVISRRAWETLPADLRPQLLEAARSIGDKSQAKIRKMGDDAIAEMKKYGLNVISPDAALQEAWRTEAEAAYPRLRGTYVPADIFDEVIRLRNEFRRGQR